MKSSEIFKTYFLIQFVNHRRKNSNHLEATRNNGASFFRWRYSMFTEIEIVLNHLENYKNGQNYSSLSCSTSKLMHTSPYFYFVEPCLMKFLALKFFWSCCPSLSTCNHTISSISNAIRLCVKAIFIEAYHSPSSDWFQKRYTKIDSCDALYF